MSSHHGHPSIPCHPGPLLCPSLLQQYLFFLPVIPTACEASISSSNVSASTHCIVDHLSDGLESAQLPHTLTDALSSQYFEFPLDFSTPFTHLYDSKYGSSYFPPVNICHSYTVSPGVWHLFLAFWICASSWTCVYIFNLLLPGPREPL